MEYRRATHAKSERGRISLASGEPFAIAGLWRAWQAPNDMTSFSFTMLTVNADLHPLWWQFHKHVTADGARVEKRAVVILRPDQYDDWLSCSDLDEARSFLGLYPAELLAAQPAPKQE